MTVQWEKVYVFISSTFNDMHAERDYLAKQVFPHLQVWCEQRKLRLVDVDLRWGVTEADATKNKRVVQVCLERIDACRPFFLCFLGQRRGWVPSEDQISPETYTRYPELRTYTGAASITEMEILHALVDPLHRGKVIQEGKVKEYTPAEHSFFYLRQADYLPDLPTNPPQLRQLYTNEGSADPARDDAELNRWRDMEIPNTGRPVHAYEAYWDRDEETPEIRLPLACPSTAEQGSDAWQAAYERWAGQWAQAGVQVEEWGEISGVDQLVKARQCNERLVRGRLRDFTCQGQPLADAILAELKAAIGARYPEHIERIHPTPLQRELDQQEQFLQAASEGFIEREGDFDALDDYLRGDENRPFILTAPGGLGKTSLLAHWIDRALLDTQRGDSLHYRFIGASDGSTTVDALLRSILGEMQIAGKLSEEIPTDPAELRNKLSQLLAAAGQKSKTVIVLDGLNQLESGLDDVAWHPLTLPPGVKLVTSLKRGERWAEAYIEQLRAGAQAILAEVKPFDSLDDRRKLVRAYLSRFLKVLDERHLEALIRSEGASNPLYLKVVLAELRVFGAFADLGEKIRSDFGTTPVSAFAGFLRRLENDPAHSPAQPELLVPRLFGWLAHSHRGLTAEELSALLAREGLLGDGETGRQRAADAVQGLLRQARPYLARREGRAEFFYESFKLAVLERYARGGNQVHAHAESRAAQVWHASLAGYFDEQPLRLGERQEPNRRKLAELAYQFAHAGMAEPLRQTLWDYRYLLAQLECGGVETLIADYELSGLSQAGLSGEEQRRLRVVQDALRLSAHILRADPGQLPSQLTGRLLSYDQRNICELLEAARRETPGAWLRPLSPSLLPPAGSLVRTLHGHSRSITSMAVTSDGSRLVSGSRDKTLKVWDLEHGVELATLRGHRGKVTSVTVTPNGRRAVSGSDSGTLKVWDLETKTELATVGTHGLPGMDVIAVTPDGHWAVWASYDGTLKVWDLESGTELATLRGHSGWVTALAVTPDGRRAVSGSRDKILKVWDLEYGVELANLQGHDEVVTSIAVTPDGQRAVSASYDGTLKVWDLESGTELATLRGHSNSVTSVAVSPKGQRAVSGSVDRTLKVWDLKSGTELATLRGHSGRVTSVAVTPDGQRAVSGSEHGTLRVWDLKQGSGSWIGKALYRWRETGWQKLFGHISSVTAMAVTPDGQVVFASFDGRFVVKDPRKGVLAATARPPNSEGITSMVVTPDGQRVVSGSAYGTLKVWDMKSRKELASLRGHGGWITSIAVTPDGRWAVSASHDKTLKVWDLASGTEMITLPGHSDWVTSVAVTPDGRQVISGSIGGTLKVRDLESGTEMATWRGHSGEVTSVTVTPDRRQLVSGSTNGKLKVWDLESGKELAILHGHNGEVTSVAVTPDGQRAISASGDKTLRVWDLESRSALATYTDEGGLNACVVCPDGVTICAGGDLGRVCFLQLENVPAGAKIVAAWRQSDGDTQQVARRSVVPHWQFWRRGPIAEAEKATLSPLVFVCPYCRKGSEISEIAPGTELDCPNCGELVKVNPFVIKSDWRPMTLPREQVSQSRQRIRGDPKRPREMRVSDSDVEIGFTMPSGWHKATNSVPEAMNADLTLAYSRNTVEIGWVSYSIERPHAGGDRTRMEHEFVRVRILHFGQITSTGSWKQGNRLYSQYMWRPKRKVNGASLVAQTSALWDWDRAIRIEILQLFIDDRGAVDWQRSMFALDIDVTQSGCPIFPR